jgi:hypothetical protein
VDVVLGVGGGSLFVLMIETPHPLHTHSRYSLYIYKVFQHLLQWLQVIGMPPHSDISSLWDRGRVDVIGVGGGRWVSVCSYD